MGDWVYGNDQQWHYQPTAPAPDPTVTSMFPAVVEQSAKVPAVVPEQDDLSHLDQAVGELVNTEKLGPLDEVLIQPPQDPNWRPEGRDYRDWYQEIGAEPA